MISVHRMIGKLVLLAVMALPVGEVLASGIMMNFSNADIRSVIKFVSEFSHKNFLIDKRVGGKVTIISSSEIPEEDAYKVFLSILEANGFTAVDDGGVTKIIPVAEGRTKAIEVRRSPLRGGGDQLITQIISLKHADAQQLVGILRPLMSRQSHIVAYGPANVLVATDVASNVNKILNIIEALDVSDAVRLKLLPLAYASAEKLATTLRDLYKSNESIMTDPTQESGKISGPLRIISHNPGNVLIVVGNSALLSEVVEIVKRLDVPPKADSARLQVRYLRNAEAETVAKVIAELVNGQNAEKVGEKRPTFAGEVKVVADPATNALLITADPVDRKAINALIDKLDIRRLQVLVEAMIIEISADGAEQFGIEFQSLDDFTRSSGKSLIGGTSFSVSGSSIKSASNAEVFSKNPLPGSGLVVGVVDGTIDFAGKRYLNLGALLRALETHTDANVLSTPNILTMDNEEAEIIVGQNVPFVTGQNVTQGGTANPFQTIQREDVGLTLRVTPQISEGDTIRLKIFQEISSIVPSSQSVAATSDIVTNKRSIKTTVLANDGNIIVLGGLMRDDHSTSVKQVPCVGSIPVVGEPFKFTENIKKKTNLMVFLRPHIIRSRHDIEAITNEKYRRVEDIYRDQTYRGTRIFSPEKPPLPLEFPPRGN